jgi:Zn-dependent alcohol dehydrogenase
MRGIVWNGVDAEVRTDVEVRAPGPNEVLVRVAAAGVCHSDVSVINGTIPWPAPALMGHEGAGVVEAVGSECTRVKVGDHVVIATVASCGICNFCATGHVTWCRQSIANRTEPFTVGGVAASNFAATSSFAEVTVVKEIQAVPIDKDVPLTSACLIACGVITGLGSVFNRANVEPGQSAAVFGAGAGGVNWSFECVGHPAVTAQAVDVLDWGGSCVQVGVPAPGVTYAVPITFLTQVDRSIIGSRAGGVRAQHDIPMIVDLYKRGLFDLDSMVTKTYPMENIHEVMEDMHDGKLARGVLTF